MTKHTPGPWLLVTYQLTQETAIIADNGDEVAVIDFSFRPDAHYDAHLIAAAPDLLEALEDLLPWLEDARMADGARAAIAKARGQG